jgi:hypothetical protein
MSRITPDEDDEEIFDHLHGDDFDARRDGAYEDWEEGLIHFADPGGVSALRAETPDNPRDCPCPTCGREDMLTREDARIGYQCDSCADRAERGCDY